jgi:predicted RNase H-like HicB family nuclease
MLNDQHLSTASDSCWYNDTEVNMKLRVLVQAEQQNGYEVRIPGMPGCVSHGSTVDEALKNLRTAASHWLDQAMDDLDVQVIDQDAEDQQAYSEALSIRLPTEKLKRLAATQPPPASWYDEDFTSP